MNTWVCGKIGALDWFSNAPANEPVKEARMPFQHTCKKCGKSYTRAHRRRSSSFCSHACRYSATVEERFWSKVDRSGGPDACWPWLARRTDDEYGTFAIGREQKLAHRVAFFLEHGRWPEPCGLHACDNPPCCNPAHIFEGTQLDNVKDMVRKGRHRVTVGVNHWCAKLNEQHVRQIRASHAMGEMNAYDLSILYGVSRTHIYDIIKGKTWRHVDGQETTP